MLPKLVKAVRCQELLYVYPKENTYHIIPHIDSALHLTCSDLSEYFLWGSFFSKNVNSHFSKCEFTLS